MFWITLRICRNFFPINTVTKLKTLKHLIYFKKIFQNCFMSSQNVLRQIFWTTSPQFPLFQKETEIVIISDSVDNWYIYQTEVF